MTSSAPAVKNWMRLTMVKAVFNILGSALGASSVSFACYPGVDLCMCLSWFFVLGDAMKESEKTKREMNIYLSLSFQKITTPKGGWVICSVSYVYLPAFKLGRSISPSTNVTFENGTVSDIVRLTLFSQIPDCHV